MSPRRALVALTAVALLAVAAPAHADNPTLTAPAAAYVGSQYVTITATGPLTFATNNASWAPNLTFAHPGCSAKVVGSRASGQYVQGSCTGPGWVTGWLTYSSWPTVFTTDAGATLSIQAAYVAPDPAPEPAPAPTFTVTRSAPGSWPYTVTVTNTSTVDAPAYSYVDTAVTPSALAAVSAPGFTRCDWRYVVTRTGTSYQGNGFVCRGAAIPAGTSRTIVVAS